MALWWRKPTLLSEMTRPLPRATLIERGRVALLDDSDVEMLEDLKEAGFAIDHLKSSADKRFHHLVDGLYHVLLIDFFGVGAGFGSEDGLSVLRHLTRVNPGLRTIAFTGRSFDSSRADFFRLCSTILQKDAGIDETTRVIEEQLQIAMAPPHLWSTLSTQLGITGAEAQAIEKKLSKALGGANPAEKAQDIIRKVGTAAGDKTVEKLVEKVVESVVKYGAALL